MMNRNEIMEAPAPQGETAALIKIGGATYGDLGLGIGRIALKGQQVTVGRAVGNDVVIADTRISRNHLTLTYQNSKWFIKDQSLNGMYVNGRHLVKDVVYGLGHDDVLQLIPDDGQIQDFKYRIEYNQSHHSNEIGIQSPSTSNSAIIGNRNALAVSNQVHSGATMIAEKKKIKKNEGKENESGNTNGTLIPGTNCGSKAPASTNITADFDQLELSRTGKRENSTMPPKPSEITMTTVQDESGEDSQDSDCVIIEDEPRLPRVKHDTKTPAVVADPSFPLDSTKKRSNPELPSKAKAALIEEIMYLRKAIADATKAQEEELKSLESNVEQLKTEIQATKTRENFKADLSKRFQELQCSVCNGQFIEPVRLDPCGHVFCGFCINESNKHSEIRRCPQCQVIVKEQSNDVVLDNLISEGFTVMPETLLQERREKISRRSK